MLGSVFFLVSMGRRRPFYAVIDTYVQCACGAMLSDKRVCFFFFRVVFCLCFSFCLEFVAFRIVFIVAPKKGVFVLCSCFLFFVNNQKSSCGCVDNNNIS